jgi:hypothetical protein
LPSGDPGRAAETLHALAQVGVTRFIAGGRYANASEFRLFVDDLVAARDQLG